MVSEKDSSHINQSASKSNNAGRLPSTHPTLQHDSVVPSGFWRWLKTAWKNDEKRLSLLQMASTAVLSFLSLILTAGIFVNQYRISVNQAETLKLQKILQTPDIEVVQEIVRNPRTGAAEGDIVRVVNSGAAIRDAKIDTMTFVRASLPGDGNKVREVHFMGYYDVFRTGKIIDDVFRLEGGANYTEMSRMTTELRYILGVQDKAMKPLSAVVYVKLRFKDKFNDLYTECFLCASGDQAIRITEDEWKKKHEIAENAKDNGSSLLRMRVTATELLNRLKDTVPVQPPQSIPD